MINIANALLSAPPAGTVVSGGSGVSTTFSTTQGSPLVSSSSSLLPIASIVVEILALFVGVAIIGLFIIIVVANRAEPDTTGHRPQSVYFFAVSFVTLVTTIIGSIVVVFSVVDLIGHHSSGIGNAVARAVVIGGLITLLSGALLLIHLRRGVALVGPDAASPSRRVAQSYVSGVAFLSVLILLVVSILAVYLLFALGGPGVFGSFGGRTPALRDLIDAVYVGLVAVTVLLTHRNLVTPGLRFFGRGNGPRGGVGTIGRHASAGAGAGAVPPPGSPG
ncbi:MAG: hypothetical protein ABSH29_10830 [Acidimicrobiales bacterium]|jgi:hypothetical protein